MLNESKMNSIDQASFNGMNPYGLREGEVSSGVMILFTIVSRSLILFQCRQQLWQSHMMEELFLAQILELRLGHMLQTESAIRLFPFMTLCGPADLAALQIHKL